MTDKKDSDCCAPATPMIPAPTTGDEAEEELAALAAAIGHPARVAIIRILLERENCICGEIVEELPLAQSTVSQHLKKLKDAGLIRGSVDGPRVCYCAEPAMLERLKRLVCDILIPASELK